MGLTHSKKSGSHSNKLVNYSNGETGYMVHYATIDKKNKYSKNIEKYNLSIDDEKRTKSIALNSKKYKKSD